MQKSAVPPVEGGSSHAVLKGLLVVCLVAAFAPVAEAQKKTFSGRTQVLEVQIPVNVVDKEGNPITGLTVEDFEIYEGKQEQQITAFEVIDLETLDPGASRTEVEQSIASAARRHFFLLFDLSFSSPASIVRARKAAREFVLEELHDTDLVAVATHSVEGGARMLVTFTPDRAQIARAIDTLGAPRLNSLRRSDPLRFLIDDPDTAAASASIDLNDLTNQGVTNQLQQSVAAHIRVIAKEMVKMEKSFARGRVSSWSHSMADLARMLDSVSGRKHVVYFSSGFDGRLLLGRQPDADDQEMQADLASIRSGQPWAVDTDDLYGNTLLQTEVGRMLEEFRRADCVIQAVDISGLTADSAAEERANRVGQDALFYIANDTGGELFNNANNFGEELVKVLERSSVTYLLTFRPNIVADGAYHRVRVKVNAPRARVSARQGYYAPRPFEELHPFEKNLLAADGIASAEPKRDVTMNVLAAPFKADETQAYVPIIVEINGASLLEDHEDSSLPVEIYAYVTDERGEMKDFLTQLVTLDIAKTRGAFAEAGLKYYGHLSLTPGEYLVRVLVRNGSTGRTGVETLSVDIPSYGEAEPVLLPPFFVETAGSWVLVRETARTYQKNIIYPFTVNGEPYVPAARPDLSGREEVEVCLVAYNLGAEAPELKAVVLGDDGEEVDGGSLLVRERTITGIEGLDKFLATFRPARGMKSGDYTLQVALTDPVSGLTELNSVPFTLN